MEKDILLKVQKAKNQQDNDVIAKIKEEDDFFGEDLQFDYLKPKVEKHKGSCHCGQGCPNHSILD